MARFEENNRAILTLIFSASLASLSFEIALLRIFSISLWYHFAFMVISIAMLGIAASGTVLAVFPALKDIRRVSFYGLMLGASIPVSYLLANAVPFDPARLSWDRLQLLAISLYYIILCVPFFCFGLIVSIAYSAISAKSKRDIRLGPYRGRSRRARHGLAPLPGRARDKRVHRLHAPCPDAPGRR